MSHQVFLSYKREDEERAARIAQALTHHGLVVWWDRTLRAGESWHEQIGSALDAAGCTVVLWSEGSVGPDGGYVRDEARRAHARGSLVPVLIDRVAPPLGLGEIQALDLTRWHKRPRDPFFLDLVASVRAKLDGRPMPAARGPAIRWGGRFKAGGVGTVLLAMLWMIGADLFDVRERVCTVGLAQPGLSDACGSLGIGHRPTREERLEWTARPAGSCAALRDHLVRFPEGAYRTAVAEMLAAARVERTTDFSPAPREVRGYVRQSERGFADGNEARTDATRRAEIDANTLTCAPRDAYERLAGVSVECSAFDCRMLPSGGTTCALDYRARCRIEARAMVERCGT